MRQKRRAEESIEGFQRKRKFKKLSTREEIDRYYISTTGTPYYSQSVEEFQRKLDGEQAKKAEKEKIQRFVKKKKLNLERLGLPEDYEFNTYNSAKIASSAQNKNMTIREYEKWKTEQAASRQGVDVKTYERLKREKTAANKGIKSEGEIPARVIANRISIKEKKEAGKVRQRYTSKEARRADEIAKGLGFCSKSSYHSFKSSILSLVKYKEGLMYKASFYNDYPEDTDVGQFLRAKPDGSKFSFMGKNMHRIVNKAIEATVPRHETTQRMWEAGGERIRYGAVLKKFRNLLEDERPDAAQIHSNNPVIDVMCRFDSKKKFIQK